MAADTPQTDEQLVAAIRSGHRESADELARRWWEPIRRFCANYLNDEALAEDVAQETFARLADGALPDGQVKPWLYKLARNQCLDILRRHQRSPTHNRPIRTGFDVTATATGIVTRAHRDERRERIYAIIQQMPDEYRSVLLLRFFEGFSREEMAAALGVSEQTVKGRLARASEALYEELAKITRAGP